MYSVAGLLFALFLGQTPGQSATPPSTTPTVATAPGAAVSREEIEKLAKELKAEGKFIDRLIKAVDVPGGTIAVAIVHRVQSETGALAHRDASETYHILEGSGTITTGGSLHEWRSSDLTRLGVGVTLSGRPEGGESKHLGPNEVIMIPPGVPHRWSQLDGPITYLVFRYSPSGK